MSGVRASVKEIVEQYGRDGALAAQSVESAEFGVWDRLTPGVLLVLAISVAAVEDPNLALRLGGVGQRAVAPGGLGGHALIELDTDEATVRWERAVGLLLAYASTETLEDLLAQAEDLWTGVLSRVS